MILTSSQVKKVIYAFHPEAGVNPTRLQTIHKSLELQNYIKDQGIVLKCTHTSGSLWLMGEELAQRYIQDLISIIKTVEINKQI